MTETLTAHAQKTMNVLLDRIEASNNIDEMTKEEHTHLIKSAMRRHKTALQDLENSLGLVETRVRTKKDKE